MRMLEQRVRRYLLARLRRRAVINLYQTAATVGLLEGRSIGGVASGQSWVVSDKARQFLAGAPKNDRKIVRRMMGNGGGHHGNDVAENLVGPNDNGEAGGTQYDWSTPKPVDKQMKPKAGRRAGGGAGGSKIGFSYVADLLMEQLSAPSPMHVATSLLIARAIGTSLPTLSVFTDTLRLPTPFVLIKAPVGRFEASVGMMLEDGLLLPFHSTLEDVLRDGPLSGRYKQGRSSAPQRKLKTVAGSAALKCDVRTLRGQLRQAMTDEPAPIVVVDQTLFALTPVMTDTPDLVVECGGFDRPMIADLLHICLGAPPDETQKLMEVKAFDPHSLSIDDLVLAVRPGRSAAAILAVLSMLVERCAQDEAADQETTDGDRRRGSGGNRNSAKSSTKGETKAKPQDVGIEVIYPEVVASTTPTDADGSKTTSVGQGTRVATVETLCGYGGARDWAIDLKADLALWREGALDWSELSAKLLLSGPPGTGKTSFARALCNTLEVPLFVTSVANWLEPGYLGDVLQRMSAAFMHATIQAPAILFIDEIDNIGTRQSAGPRNHDDYWVSLINRLLELLDGAAKTEGVVIVAATNLPEKIDPALLRSGRLETHVRIPLPDVETLSGILANHLGADLPGVLSSAPANRPQCRLRSPPARDHDPQQLRRNSENRKANKRKRASP